MWWLEILSVLLLMFPTAWEIWDDRNGDAHGKGNDDWILRGLLMLVASTIVFFINPAHNFAQAFILSFGIFIFFFPWIVNYVHFKRGIAEDPRWWSRMHKTAPPDSWDWYGGLDWYIRLIMLAILFAFCIRLYTCWDFTAWNSCQNF